MPGSVIGNQMDFGYPGQASRHGDEVSRTRPVKAGTENIYFGSPVVINADGSCQLFGASNVAVDFGGIAMRKVKSAVVYPYQNFGYYREKEPCDILERGGISAICAWGTPTVGGVVYVRIGVTEGTSPDGAKIGDLGAAAEVIPGEGGAADTVNTVALVDVVWSSGMDARKVAELTMKTRQGV